jgi:hypothetical protein
MTDKPRLVVRLKTDEAGRPVVRRGARYNHYGVVFEVQNAPTDAFLAGFELDPEAYYDAYRSVTPTPEGTFRLETTTYGDYPLIVRLFRPSGVDVILREKIAQGLRREYGSDILPPTIAQAVSDIAAH